MECPRCGGPVSEYQLGDAETVACDDCSYVGVTVDHTSRRERPESWTDALDRFYSRHTAQQVEAVVEHEAVPLDDAVLPVFEPDEAAGDEQTAAEEAVRPVFESADGAVARETEAEETAATSAPDQDN